MSATPQVTRKQLLKAIDELEKNPHDKVRLLGDAGITIVGAGLGYAAVGAIAGTAGVTTLLGSAGLGTMLGGVFVAATPVGWVLGTTVAAGAAAYGISRMIRSGGLAEGRKAELLQKYKEEAKRIESKERAGDISESDRTQFHLSLRELIDKEAIPPDTAARLIEQVEQGRIPLSQANSLIQTLLQDGHTAVTKISESSHTDEPVVKSETLTEVHQNSGLAGPAMTSTRSRISASVSATGTRLASRIGLGAGTPDKLRDTFRGMLKKSNEVAHRTADLATDAYHSAKVAAEEAANGVKDRIERSAKSRKGNEPSSVARPDDPPKG